METLLGSTKAPRKMRRGCGCFLALALLIGIGLSQWWSNANRELVEAEPIAGASIAPIVIDPAFTPSPVPGAVVPHPGMAAASDGSMHADGFQSDTHVAAGPFGPDLEVRSRRAGNGLPRQCATFVFRSDGKPVSLCGGLTGFRIVLLDPETLAALATYDMPMRPSSFQALIKADISVMMSDSSGGAYLFLDNKDRVVFADAQQVIQRIRAVQADGKWQFIADKQWDMRKHVPNDCLNWNNWFPSGECDMITTVLPDHAGRYWWTTRFGRVGTLDPISGKVEQVRLNGEEIQNAMAVDASSVFVLSDHAQYAFVADQSGKPVQKWRHAYDRGSGRKVGSINQGSGTTPTLLGDRWLTFADNADPQIRIIVLRRGTLLPGERREICRVPVFKPGASATDNSMIGWGRSIILENNAGFTSAFEQKDWGAIAGGVVRVDIRADGSGCDIVWTSPLKVPSVVPKLSSANGIAYFYSFDLTKDGKQNWSIAGLDFRTGKQILKVPTGQGQDYDNNWASLSVSPGGVLYAGTKGGLVQVRAQK